MVLEQSASNKEHGTLENEGEEGKNDSSRTRSVTVGSEEERRRRRRRRPYSSWWNKVLDVEEAKNQLLLSLPLMLTNVSYFAIPLISVMFAAHLGDLELASSNLANSWANVSGFCFVIGLSGALETLCGQGYGAKLYRMMGIYLQASCYISILFSILISVLWLFTEPILILLHQDPKISKMAALYIKYLVPGLFSYGLTNCLLRFLQMQSSVLPLVICSILPFVIHIGLCHVLVHWTSLGFTGAPLATSISFCISLFMMAIYVLCAKKLKETWQGFSLESFNHLLTNLKLALPSAAMVCLEFWAFELMVLLAGVMPNPEITTPLMAMCLSTESNAYMLLYGLSAAVSTRVSNELGAGNPDKAKHAMVVTLQLSILFGLIIIGALGIGHTMWAGLFSDNPIIISKFTSMTPLLLTAMTIDTVQGILGGVARGCGWQKVVVFINLPMFYLIGVPLAVALAFKLKLYTNGIYVGLICGLSCQTVCLLWFTCLKKWTRVELHRNNNAEDPV